MKDFEHFVREYALDQHYEYGVARDILKEIEYALNEVYAEHISAGSNSYDIFELFDLIWEYAHLSYSFMFEFIMYTISKYYEQTEL